MLFNQVIRFKKLPRTPEGLDNFLVQLFEAQPSIKAYSIVLRLVGLIMPDKLPTIVVFYDDEDQFHKDNEIIGKALEQFFKNADSFVELIPIHVLSEEANEVAVSVEKIGASLIEIN